MNVLMAIDFPLTNTGGVVTSLKEQIASLRSSGHTVFLLQLAKNDSVNKKTQQVFIEANFFLPKALFGMGIIRTNRKNIEKLSHILATHAIDYVHVQSEFSLAFALHAAAKKCDIPFFYTIHSFFWQFELPFFASPASWIGQKTFEYITKTKLQANPSLGGNPVEKLLKKITFTMAEKSTVVISPSHHQLMFIRSVGVTAPSYVVPNPFTSATTKPIVNMPSRSKKPLRFLLIGRLVPEKRPQIFLQAATIAAKNIGSRAFVVDVIGNGPLARTLKNEFHSTFIHFHGEKTHDAVIDTIDQTSVVVLASYHFDNQPMIIAEAISRGRPVLYCDERLTEGLSGASIVTPTPTAEAFAEIIIDLVKHPEKLKKLSEQAEKNAAVFSRKSYMKNIEAITTDVFNLNS